MPAKRIYDDGCGIAHAMNVIGERWAILIVRELLLGPKRFSDLQAGLPGAGPNILAQRLRDLETSGVLRRTTLPPPAGSKVYELTDWGAQLGPVLAALGAWGNACPTSPPSGPVGADSVMLGLLTSFRPPADATWSTDYDLTLGTDRYSVRVTNGRLDIRRGPAYRAHATITTDTSTLAAVLNKKTTPSRAIKDGQLTAHGDIRAVKRLLSAATP